MSTTGVVGTSSVVVSLLTKDNLTRLQGTKNKEEICAAILIVTKVIMGAVEALRTGELKKLDGNPGNGSCQNQALVLRKIVSLDLSAECTYLYEEASKLHGLLRCKGISNNKLDAWELFKEKAEPLQVTTMMDFVLHAHLLWLIKRPYETLANGIVNTRSDPGTLVNMAKPWKMPSEIAKKLVEESQVHHSAVSMDQMRLIASGLRIENKALLQCMLSEEQTHVHTSNVLYKPKVYGCLFYLVQTTLLNLRQEEALVCLKSIVTQGKPIHLLFQSKKSGEELELLPDEACKTLDQKSLVVVFEAVVAKEKEEAAALLVREGFTETMLCKSALDAPYERTSNLSAVKVDAALTEIQRYRAMDKGVYLTLDHVYLNTLGKELS